MSAVEQRFVAWIDWLFERHSRDLTFQELRRSVQALSGAYVERRRLAEAPRALDGKGKRAAFACFYGPLHFLVVRTILGELGHPFRALSSVWDLGCGTLSAGIAWASALEMHPAIEGIDLSRWAIAEAARNLDYFGCRGRARVSSLVDASLPKGGAGIVLAFAVNEVAAENRKRLLQRLIAAAKEGCAVLVVEPIARSLTAQWWPTWESEVIEAGGRADTWRFAVELPARLRELDRAAGLDHREMKARSLWLG